MRASSSSEKSSYFAKGIEGRQEAFGVMSLTGATGGKGQDLMRTKAHRIPIARRKPGLELYPTSRIRVVHPYILLWKYEMERRAF